MQINTSIPAEIQKIPHSSFNEQTTNDYVTHCKLKVFYVGETSDHRLFTKDFSEKLVQTLPQTPVIAHYNEDDDDFNAHHENQSVYGYVPESSQIEFVEEDGVTWAFTDIVLFTGREDSIGEVASKIIGKQQSLELDPDTVDYRLHKDSNGKIERIEFLDGSLTGVSVVGDNETPAFTGSQFFKDKDDEFKEFFKKFEDIIDTQFTNSRQNEGGVKVNFLEKYSNEIAPKIHEYLTNTYDELQMEVMEQLFEKNENAYPVQIGEDFVVYLDFGDGEFYRADYTRSEGEQGNTIDFKEPVYVKPRYLTNDEIEAANSQRQTEDAADMTDNGGQPEADDPKDNPDDPKTDMTGDNTPGDGEDGGSNSTTLTESEQREIEETKQQLEEYKEQLEEKEKQLNSYAAELDKYKSQEKKEMLADYKDLIKEEDFKAIQEKINEYALDDLEVKLSVAVAKKVKEDRDAESNSDYTPRTFVSRKKAGNKDDFDGFVEAYKDKE